LLAAVLAASASAALARTPLVLMTDLKTRTGPYCVGPNSGLYTLVKIHSAALRRASRWPM
jgi:hypothetical protein